MGKKKDVVVRGSSYLFDAWNMRGMAKWAKTVIPEDVDTMVGTGMSGALIVPRLASRLGLFWGVVRKPGVSSHGISDYEGQMGRKWIIVDDFICSGETVIRIVKTVQEEFKATMYKAKWETEFAGFQGYSDWNKEYTQPFRDAEQTAEYMRYGNGEVLRQLLDPDNDVRRLAPASPVA